MTGCCPHHPGRALEALRTPAQALGCRLCDGLWLGGELVARVLGHRPTTHTLNALPASTLACPEDGATLHAVHHAGVEIDVCPRCAGVWLDRGELEAILASRHTGNDDDDIAHIIEDLFDVVPSRRARKTNAAEVGDATPASANTPRIAETRNGSGSSSGWQLERADPPSSPQSAAASTSLESSVDVDAAGAVDGGVLESVGDAIGSVFEFIGEAFSGL